MRQGTRTTPSYSPTPMPNSTAERSGFHRASGGKRKNMDLPKCCQREFRSRFLRVSPWLNGSEPAGASLCVGVIRLRGVTPPPRLIGRCRCIGRRIVRNRSGIIRSSQRTGDDPTDDRRCPPTTAAPTTAAAPTITAMMTLRLRYAGGANHDSRAQSDDSLFH
jgi:hypothetical protein